MTADERALCAVMAALLARGRLIHGLSLPFTLGALVAIVLLDRSLDIPRLGVMVLAISALAGLCETVFAARVAFDADMFQGLGAGELDLPTMDRALGRLRLAPAAKLGRSLDARLAGARRLLLLELAAFTAQFVLVMVFCNMVWVH